MAKETATEQHNPPREDNKILQKEVDHAVRDAKEGDKYAKDFGSRVKSAAEKLEDEIKNTVDQGSNESQTKKNAKSKGSKPTD